MKDLLHKAWLFGAGVFDFTKDKVEALVQEMVRRGEITQQESSEAVKQLLAKAQEAQQAMVAKVKELTKSTVDEIKVAKASDLEALEARVAALEEGEVNTMKELLHKAWLFGAGVFDFTKDKVEALVQEMVRRGEITQQESSETVKQLLAKAQEAQQGLVAKVKELTKSAVDEIKVAKASDLRPWKTRVAALEEALKER